MVKKKMRIDELRIFLEKLSINQLKLICNKPRSWGVYNSSPAIAGYSKCKNKEELIDLIFNYFNYYSQKHYGDNESRYYDGYVQKDIDYTYEDDVIKMKTIKINFIGE